MGALDCSLLEDRIRFCVGGWEYNGYSEWEDVTTVCGGCDYVFGGCDYSVWEDVTTVGGCEQCVEDVTTVYGRM